MLDKVFINLKNKNENYTHRINSVVSKKEDIKEQLIIGVNIG